MILNIIRKTIAEHNLIERGDSVLIGLSGGADSVCLTHALFSLKEELGLILYTAHLNHGIRGEEAKRDEEFAKSFSESLGIKCFVIHADIPQIAKEKGISEETAGRQARYDFFDKICKEHSIDKIATAHNKNDNAETLLMNFMRGSGIKGLCGIPYGRDNIIRPLLDIKRDEIEAYCMKNTLDYVTDSTNEELLYTRNKIRHKLLPLIQEEFNSGFTDTVTGNASLMCEDSEYLEKRAEKAYNDYVSNGGADKDSLLKLDIALRRRVVRLMIKNVRQSLEDIPSVYVNDVLSLLNKNSGASVNLSDGIIARIEYGRLIIERETGYTKPFEYTLKCNSSCVIPEVSSIITVSEADKRQRDGAVYLSCDASSDITVRSRREGDVFRPYGMTGSKKVKEYFINEKIPRGRRNMVPIIEINGQIASVGSRVDRGFLFRDKGIKIEFRPIQEVTD